MPCQPAVALQKMQHELILVVVFDSWHGCSTAVAATAPLP